MIFQRAACLLLPLLLGACAVPMRISLTPEQRAGIQELKAHVIVVQDEVLVAVQPSNVSAATGGGLIGAMIDSSITNSRVKASQEIMGPFYLAIEDVDYRQEFNATIQRELSRHPIKVAAFATTPRALSQAELTTLRNQLPAGQALLVVAPRYHLAMDFRTLDAEAVVSTWIKGGQDNMPVHRGVLYYQSQPVGSGGKDSIALWSADNAAAFRAAVRESIAETMHLVMMDMQVTGEPGTPAKAYPFNTGAQQGQITGHLIKETPQRATVLGVDKKLYSLPKTSQAAAAAAL